MNPRNISIRSRFFKLVTGSVMFWLLAGFLIFSLINNLTRYQDTSLQIQSIPEKVLHLRNAIQSFYIHGPSILQQPDRLLEYLVTCDNYIETRVNKSRQEPFLK